MFKRITFLFVVALASLSANAQFKVEEDTLYAYGFAGTNSLDLTDIPAETHIMHMGLSNEMINWRRTVNDLPDPEWTSAVCDIVFCRGPEVDTGSFMFEAGDTGFLSFHFYPKNIKGDAKMVVRFSRASNPLEYVDVVIMGRAWKPVGISAVNTSVTSVMPNPAKTAVTFSNDKIENGNLEVYNAMGQLVLSTTYANLMTLDIKDFASGIYTVKISDATHTSVSRIVKE
jgi:hypothetical protein